VPWDSTGRRANGETFSRPGRATLLLVPRNKRLGCRPFALFSGASAHVLALGTAPVW
jgi:hypothetical protein